MSIFLFLKNGCQVEQRDPLQSQRFSEAIQVNVFVVKNLINLHIILLHIGIRMFHQYN